MPAETTTRAAGAAAWEGYGGPVRHERANLASIDPTMDACCQREEESLRHRSALRNTVRRFDVAAKRERQRKNLVTTSAFDGCRCCYDPDGDGGTYPALVELRQEMLRLESDQKRHDQNDEEEKDEEETLESGRGTTAAKGPHNPLSASNDDDDDEFDYLLDELDLPGGEDDSSALHSYEEHRRAELEFAVLQREMAAQHGFGVHRQMHPQRALRAAVRANHGVTVVLHLVDPDASSASASLDVLFEDTVAPMYPGTKFLRSNGRSTLLLNRELAAKHLPRLQPDSDLPALVAFRDGVVVAYCPRLQGLVVADGSNTTRIIPSVVLEWLDRAGVLVTHLPPLAELCLIRPEEEALVDSMYVQKSVVTPPLERYDCGLEGCAKTFPHEHIGEKTAQQDGLVVPESSILGGDELNQVVE
jgi:hypothetical protein